MSMRTLKVSHTITGQYTGDVDVITVWNFNQIKLCFKVLEINKVQANI